MNDILTCDDCLFPIYGTCDDFKNKKRRACGQFLSKYKCFTDKELEEFKPETYPREEERIRSDLYRLKTPNGWIVIAYENRYGNISSMVEVNDLNHEWILESIS